MPPAAPQVFLLFKFIHCTGIFTFNDGRHEPIEESKLPKFLEVIISPFVILVILITVIVMFLCDCSVRISKCYLQTSLFVLYIYNYLFKLI